MIDSLLRSRRLDKRSPFEVVALLGTPPRTGYFREWDLAYRLGPERGVFRIDSEWLVIRLGSEGRVSDYRVVRD